MSPRASLRRTGRGSATVTVVVLAGVLTAVALAGAVVGGVLVGQRRAAAAADLAALAGALAIAPATPSPGRAAEPCAAAAEVAEANRAGLSGCVVDGREVTVEVTVAVSGPAGVVWEVAARARAGPSGSSGPAP